MTKNPFTRSDHGKVPPNGKEIELPTNHSVMIYLMNSMNRTITVLGMHRSGTSALMGSLEQAGLYIGHTNQYAEDNIKGNRESIEILALHNDLLDRNGGSWDKPVRNLKWDPVHRALQTTIIKTFEDQPLWGFKDPRTLLTTDMWLKAIPGLELIGIFRHPFLVAQSLITRNNMPAEQALELWYFYNTNLHWLAKNKTQFPVLEFSVEAAEFNDQLQNLITVLKLDNNSVDFFDTSLRRRAIPDFSAEPVARRCLNLYETLKEIGINSM